jgi:hypothetical protein
MESNICGSFVMECDAFGSVKSRRGQFCLGAIPKNTIAKKLDEHIGSL